MVKKLIYLHTLLVSTLFGVMFTAQVLSFIGLYIAILAIPITLIITVIACWGLLKMGQSWHATLERDNADVTLFDNTLIGVSVTLMSLIFLQRMVLWTSSTLGRFIPQDFTSYHAIKAIDLWQSGSAWNLAIPYGQYPFGYESLIAFGMMLVPTPLVTGSIHALLFLILVLTLTLLFLRHSSLSVYLSLTLALGLCFAPVVFPQLTNIGKNDVFLSTTVLLATLYAPVRDDTMHPLGLAMATMMSLATKATGLYALFYLWGLVLWSWWRAYRRGEVFQYLHPAIFALTIGIMFPGGLWVIRNFVLMQTLFTSEISSFFETSILANLDNPVLYAPSARGQFLIPLGVILGLMALSLFKQHLRWRASALLGVMALTFMSTPLSAFLTAQNLTYLDVQWRFVVHGILWATFIAVVLIAPIILWVYQWVNQRQATQWLASLGTIGVAIMMLFVIGFDDLFSYDETRTTQFTDPTYQTDSIYDFISTLPDGTIYIENMDWIPIMLRQPQLTVTELRYPLGYSELYPMPQLNYVAFRPTGSFTEVRASFFNIEDWELIYDSEQGQVYRLRDS